MKRCNFSINEKKLWAISVSQKAMSNNKDNGKSGLHPNPPKRERVDKKQQKNLYTLMHVLNSTILYAMY